MPCRIESADRENYVHITFFGHWTKENGKQIMDDISVAVVQSGHKRALVDYRQADHMEEGTMMNYDEATTAATYPNIHTFYPKAAKGEEAPDLRRQG